MACTEIQDILEKFSSFTQKPTKFLSVQENVKDDIKNLVKSVYDYTKAQESSSKKSKKSLSELIVQDFDEEQIWQEIELQNTERLDQLVWEVANCMSKNELKFPIRIGEEVEENNEITEEVGNYSEDKEHNVSEDEMLIDNNEEVSEKDEEDEPEIPKKAAKSSILKENKSKVQSKKSIVDDQFFKLQEMEQFLVKEEKKGNTKQDADSDEESIDYFEDIDDGESGDEDNGNVKYDDFFGDQNDGEDVGDEEELTDEGDENLANYEEEEQRDKSKRDKKVTFQDAMSDDDDNSSDSDIDTQNITNGNAKDEKKSDFELRQQRLKEKISKLEEKTLTDSPWQLSGEVDAAKRPQNSLLQEVLDFDLTTRPPPIITEQTTLTLEDIIKRRVKDKAWDDVVKKEKPVNDQLSFRKTDVLDHSKSKQSLAQIYEMEYLKQKQAKTGEVEEEKEPEAHTQLRDAMKKLFSKLDALCHYHYTPKVPQADVKIVSNTPAISMEEVAPVATSDATLLAPEEVKKKHRGDLMSKEERSQTDKKRERRKKKKLQQKKGSVMKVTDHRNTKKGVEVYDKSLKTSKAFFQQLHDDSSSLIKSNNIKRNVKNKGQ